MQAVTVALYLFQATTSQIANYHHKQGESQTRVSFFLQDAKDNCKALVSANTKKTPHIQNSATKWQKVCCLLLKQQHMTLTVKLVRKA